MKKGLFIILIIAVLFSFQACKKKEEQPVPKSPVPKGPIVEAPSAPPPHGTPGQKTEFQLVVPPEVEEQWVQVTIIVHDKMEDKKQEFTVNIGDELKIPDSTLTVKIGPFLPDFKMSGTVITSTSNEPNNPSVGVAVLENDKQVFPPSGQWGWLYAKFPTIHSFQHERYGLTLKEGIKK